ncbi:polyhydroxyalkanoate depolymerase [Rhizobium leguminosarum]|uniref:Polyhydroxyalkanoate depolymerase n=1 Tax=Rhizobium leguminosarum TaxID=384 RepID=A0A444HKW8_RHILE|nr:polyhydroxyalkanoate depolymerase [Rhizobium leguminosarum]NKL63737.1 polyhydroxyalkanoate depolymerase [Rhizobium leguminosarum bv. viciae]RWX05864.1 polyhydroxyalkanoate depolymerase [Rhizobium leguminosarum]RWX22449.1 polyhydroxyalkanoate depolymerase [Rhizobium leguminosarum]
MLYQAYQFQDDLIAPLRDLARRLQIFSATALWEPVGSMGRHFAAALEMISRFEITHERPDFAITSAMIGNHMTPVTVETVLDMPFGTLLRFAVETDAQRPRVLVVAPLSGHFATLLRGTVQTLLRDHDVYITDWANARDVPLSAGRFGMDDYVDYIIRFLEEIGPGAHILAVCQPCVQALAAVAVMSEERHPATPRTMTLMAGPIDPRESPTKVNELAVSKSLAWFENSLITAVPWRYRGAGRRVYPGFLQLVAFMSMNMERHQDAHRKLYDHLAKGETAEAGKIKNFYDEYFAVLDLTEEFYIETIERVFQKAELATGDLTHHGRKVDPGQIRNTALLTVEGGRDDICALGQTSAAHDLCRALRPHLKRHHLQANVGHYGVFNGRRWEGEIYPVVRNMILAME